MLSSLSLLSSSAALLCSPPPTLSSVWYNIFALWSFTLLGGNAFPKAKGINPTTGLTLLWAHNPFRGNFESWQVSQQEARWTIPKRWSGKCIFLMLTYSTEFFLSGQDSQMLLQCSSDNQGTTTVCVKHLLKLSTQEDFIEFCCHEIFKAYKMKSVVHHIVLLKEIILLVGWTVICKAHCF